MCNQTVADKHMNVTFGDLLNQKSWDKYEDYVSQGIHEYSRNLAGEVATGKKMKRKIRGFVEKHFDI